MELYRGKCPRCKRNHQSTKNELAICDCFQICPLCNQQMQPYTPDLNPNTYALDTKREQLILQVCNNQSEHINNSPFFSTQKPQQIQLEKTQ